MPTIDIIVAQPITVIDVIAQRAGVPGPAGVAGIQGEQGPPGPSTGVIISDTTPGDPVTGQLWFDTDSAALLVFYDDTWVQVNLVPLPVEEPEPEEGIVTHDDTTVTHDAVDVTHT